jgi:hypothetical protein
VTRDVELLALSCAVQVEGARDGEAALKVALSAVEVLAEVVETRGFLAVADGLADAARREPRAVGTLCAQALVELSIARGGGPA